VTIGRVYGRRYRGRSIAGPPRLRHCQWPGEEPTVPSCSATRGWRLHRAIAAWPRYAHCANLGWAQSVNGNLQFDQFGHQSLVSSGRSDTEGGSVSRTADVDVGSEGNSFGKLQKPAALAGLKHSVLGVGPVLLESILRCSNFYFCAPGERPVRCASTSGHPRIAILTAETATI
jgi:hypothetical protein